ncbi:MAG TPA: N-acetylmuramoyl-L-alanine amidase [Candidatus Acidoferrales bacterium]|nr:N-acetylmuramoyl-L-alanine amidase [Candidatus Acidoferrales bacterium]
MRVMPAFVIAALLLALGAAPSRADGASLHGRLFVLDPGHGVLTPSGAPLNVGAVGPDGVQEQRVALSVADDLAQLLRAAGARVVMTRTEAHPFRIATDRRVDNRARAALANRLGATAFIAIHCDSSLDPAMRGISVFWLRPNSAALAYAVRAQLRPLALGESQFRTRDLAVTSEARVPAILVELGFLSNRVQEHLLASADFQRREALALFRAVEMVFG